MTFFNCCDCGRSFRTLQSAQRHTCRTSTDEARNARKQAVTKALYRNRLHDCIAPQNLRDAEELAGAIQALCDHLASLYVPFFLPRLEPNLAEEISECVSHAIYQRLGRTVAKVIKERANAEINA